MRTTRALGHWADRKWNVVPAELDAGSGGIEAKLPAQTTGWFINVVDERDCLASMSHETVTV